MENPFILINWPEQNNNTSLNNSDIIFYQMMKDQTIFSELITNFLPSLPILEDRILTN